MDLFEDTAEGKAPIPPPLADRMRPTTLETFSGQRHLTGEGKLLSRLLSGEDMPSLILWGPPGTGKTTLARILAKSMGWHFVSFSAVLSGVKEIRQVVKEAQDVRRFHHKKTILFVDEIHRFNKTQQDAFLPHVEDGTLVLIGATTENPSFYVNAPLLSRSQVVVLEPLSPEDLTGILKRAIDDAERGLGKLKVHAENAALAFIAASSNGDARYCLNAIEAAAMMTRPGKDGVRRITLATAQEAIQKKALLYDKAGEEHYNVISAFIKSMRGSDPDAALYWMARMLEAGEDPLFIVRRMVIFASEDVGNADPEALRVAVAVKDAFEFVGMPEGWIPLAQAATYLASAPKSNAAYAAYQEALEDVRESGPLPVPLHIRNAPTSLMKQLGYGKGYRYPHEDQEGIVPQDYLPEKLKDRSYYQPKEIGEEKVIAERLEKIKRKKGKKKG
jgi:putative ATPase